MRRRMALTLARGVFMFETKVYDVEGYDEEEVKISSHNEREKDIVSNKGKRKRDGDLLTCLRKDVTKLDNKNREVKKASTKKGKKAETKKEN